jgi:hypothetical protein
MFSTATDRIAAVGGVLYVVFVVVGFGIDSAYLGDFEAAPARLQHQLETHPPTAAFWLGLGLEFLGLGLFLVFATRVTAALARAGWWSWLAGGCALLAAAVKVASIAGALEAYLQPSRLGPQVVAGLLGFDDVADSLTQGAVAVFMLVAAIAMFAVPAAPHWLGWGGLLAFAGTLAAACGLDQGQILGLLWFVVMAWWLLRAGRHESRSEEQSTVLIPN